jgi:hypothetical protein
MYVIIEKRDPWINKSLLEKWKPKCKETKDLSDLIDQCLSENPVDRPSA